MVKFLRCFSLVLFGVESISLVIAALLVIVLPNAKPIDNGDDQLTLAERTILVAFILIALLLLLRACLLIIGFLRSKRALDAPADKGVLIVVALLQIVVGLVTLFSVPVISVMAFISVVSVSRDAVLSSSKKASA